MAFKWKNKKIEIKKLKRVPDKLRDATADAMSEINKKIFDESQDIVPVQTGNLKRSGDYDKDAKISHNNISIRVWYSADYAYAVHELREPFLLKPLMDNRRELEGLVKKKIKREFRKVGGRK